MFISSPLFSFMPDFLPSGDLDRSSYFPKSRCNYMGLPGLTGEQMVKVDKTMMEEMGISVELMMEHAGLNIARFAAQEATGSENGIVVIAGSGNNGGGGLVASRRLASWGFNVKVFLPRGKDALREVPRAQLERAVSCGADSFDGLPEEEPGVVVLDAYLGYGFKPREDSKSEGVFAFLRGCDNVISLDVPSGLDSTTGENLGGLTPRAILTIAFVKKALFLLPEAVRKNIFVIDIGVPSFIYRSRLGIKYDFPFTERSLELLEEAFRKQPFVHVEMNVQDSLEKSWWLPELLQKRS